MAKTERTTKSKRHTSAPTLNTKVPTLDRVEEKVSNGETPKVVPRKKKSKTAKHDTEATTDEAVAPTSPEIRPRQKSKKRRREEDDVEAAYMQRLAKEEAKEEAKLEAERTSKSVKPADGGNVGETAEQETAVGNRAEDDVMDEAEAEDEQDEDDSDGPEIIVEASDDEDEPFEIPKHETVTNPSNTSLNPEIEKASRTVFLGNVSTTAITSKSARTALLSHLSSVLPKNETSPTTESKTKDSKDSKDSTIPTPSIESIRFRSTAFSTTLPKKAAFATRSLMPTTTRATNAYCVYSHPTYARLAAQQLNSTVVLARHLRVDSVAHPARIDHKRCVFVGNLGFVDDETAAHNAAQEATAERKGEEVKKRKSNKPAADTEEGLWVEFGKCGKVESVRVVRDKKTRVGKGFAYVQFVVRLINVSFPFDDNAN